MNNNPTIKRETKNHIRVDFERTPLLERLKAKFINGAFLVNVIWFLFRFLLLLGVSYVILYPFYAKIAGSFMSPEDFVDVTVRLIPKYPTLEQYKAIITDNGYFQALFNTFTLAGSCAVIQTFICSLIGYGLAKFKFKGNGVVFLLVIFTMLIPHSTLQYALFMEFRYFDIFGIVGLFNGEGINLLNSYWPLLIMSLTGLGFKNGLYVFLLRQFYKGIPDELEESAYLDGSGTFRTFVQIILPLSVPMLITVFMFAFSWQWTDNFYTELFFIAGTGPKLMPEIVKVPKSLDVTFAGGTLYSSAIQNTCGLMIILPLIVIYLFAQRYIMEGIERSGITG